MAVTRIKNNQITDSTITGSKFVEKTITGGLLSDNLTYGSNLVVSGNLTVNGTTSTVDTTNTVIADPLLVLSRGTTGTPSVDSGFIVERGTSANVGFIWDESADVFAAITTTETGSTAGNVTISSYANARVGDIQAATSSLGNIDISGNSITSTNTDGAISITPNGTGDINLGADTIKVGDLNVNATVTTNGTGDLILNTNSGTNSGSITIADGLNGNITIAPNGTGTVNITNLVNSDLTSGRVVLAGVGGAIEDSANLTFNGTTLTVTGNVAVDNITLDANTISTSSGNLSISSTGGEITVSSLAITDLTSGRVPYVTTGDAIVDSANLTFNGTTLGVTGALAVDNVTVDANTISTSAGNLTLSSTGGEVTATSLAVSDLTSGRVVLAGTSGALQDNSNLTFNGTTLTVTGALAVDNVTVDANTISTSAGNLSISSTGGEITVSSLAITDLTSGRVPYVTTGDAIVDSANLTFNGTTLGLTGGMNITGDLDVDNINLNGNTIITTNTNGNLNITPNGSGEVIVSTLAITDLTSGRVPYVTTNDAITDSANLTFNGTTLGVTGAVTVDNITIDGDTISSAHSTITIDPSTAGAGGTVVIAGNLQVTGTTTTVDSTVVTIADPVFQIGADSADTLDRGIKALYNDGASKIAFFGLDDSADEFVFIHNATDTSSVFSGSLGNAAFGSLRVTDLTDNRVLIAGASGEVEDSANLTFNGTTLAVTGNIAVDNITLDANTISTSAGNLTLSSTGGEVTATSLAVSDLTSGRVVLAGTSGALQDSTNLTFNGTTLTVTGNIAVDNVRIDGNTVTTSAGNLALTSTGGEVTATSLAVSDLTSGRIVFAGASGALSDAATLLWDGTDLTAGSAKISDLTSGRVVLAGTSGALEDSGNLTFNGTTLTVTGALAVDNINLNGNTIITTNTNGNLNITPNGTGEVIVSTLAITDLTSGRVPYVTTNDAITDSANLTFNGTTLTVTGSLAVDNVTVDANTISTSAGNLSISSTGGEVTVSSLAITDLTSGRVPYVTTGDAIVDSANLTFNGTTLTVTGVLTVDNVTVNGNSITSSNALTLDAASGQSIVINEAGSDVDVRIESDTQVNALFVEGSSGNIGIKTATPNAGADIHVNSTNSIIVPVGTTLQRPTGATGMIRFNSTNSSFEFYDGTAWQNAGSDFTIITADDFSGDGSTVGFTLSEDATSAGVMVMLNGVVQDPGTAYSVSGTTLTFTEAPAGGDNIDVRIITTTATVTAISDLDTIIEVDDTAETATTTINGNVVMTVTNAAVVPGANVTYDLGTSSLRWKDLYLSGTTLALGNLRLKDNGSNVFGIFQSDGTTPATLSGNASTATKWATARTITLDGDLTGNVSIDGSANVTLTATVAANSVALGTDTTGNYVQQGATSGNGLSGSVNSEGGTFTVTSNATSANTANTIVFRDGSGNFSAGVITATATTARYADLAENYTADQPIEPGTVVMFGGDAEITICSEDMCRRVAGIVSTNPAHLMNSALEAEHVVALALQGRVPCKVVGTVRKGDMMVSAGNGAARAEAEPKMGSVIGKALENFDGSEGVIEVLVGRL